VTAGLVALLAFSASASACSNEVLRSELHSAPLPDCRAYELVSPSYKEGALITNTYAVSADGSRVIGGSIGTFADAEQLTLSLSARVSGAAYLFSRSPTGWTPASLGPPGSSYRSHGLFDASADLSASLWKLSTLEQSAEVSDLYLERPRGTFTRVGPATPSRNIPNNVNYTYLGGSSDLSRIVFSAGPDPSFRWPFDGTVTGGTLYEYTGVEQQAGETREPTLVGVEGGRGSTALVSHCGTRLGSSSLEENVLGSMYNAVSASGRRIFFTAVGMNEATGCEGPPVSEVFAREERPLVNEESSPASMGTVPISEPEASACGACLAGEELKTATFQGASVEGTKVFFTTEQKLLPGVEGENLYEYDFAAPEGERVTQVSSGASDPEVQGVARISEDGSHAYFVAKGILTGAANGVGGRAIAGEDNLYLYEEGHTAFVATLSPSDSGDWSSVDDRPVLASSEGRFLVFTSVTDVTKEGLSGSKPQVFQYDTTTGGLVRASIGQDGYNGNGVAPANGSEIRSRFPSSYGYSFGDSPTAVSSAQAPANGAVFFSSPDALTPQALDDQQDFLGQLVPNVYEYRAGQVYLISDGHDTSSVNSSPGVYLAGSDASGDDVFFFTSDSLLTGDGNTQQDLYEARVGGGLTPSAFPPACAGEACRGALAAAPALAPLGGSATQAADAEVLPAVSAPAKPKTKTTLKKKKQKAKRSRKAKKKVSRARLRSSVRGHSVPRPRSAR
jgi:hypothetical protein